MPDHSVLDQSRNTELLAKAVQLLEVDALVVEQALSWMLTKGDLILERIGSEDLIFLPYLVRAEKEIAQRIARWSSLSSTLPRIDFDRAVAWFETALS